jgi:hypothetical protein
MSEQTKIVITNGRVTTSCETSSDIVEVLKLLLPLLKPQEPDNPADRVMK